MEVLKILGEQPLPHTICNNHTEMFSVSIIRLPSDLIRLILPTLSSSAAVPLECLEPGVALLPLHQRVAQLPPLAARAPVARGTTRTCAYPPTAQLPPIVKG